jgi:AcrR family transcriptional regulator
MSPREDVSEERREQILDAATDLFARKGFDQTRMDDIVRETELSKGALYWYFKSKDDIIFAILDRIFQHEFRELEPLKHSVSSASHDLNVFTEMAIKDVERMLGLMPIAYEFLALAFRNRLVQQALREYFNRYIDILDPVIQRGVASGEFRDVDPRQVSLAACAIFEGTILLWVYDRNLVNPSQSIRDSIGLLMAGIKA